MINSSAIFFFCSVVDSVEKESKINTAEIPKTGSIFGGFGHGLTAKPFSDSLKSNFSEGYLVFSI